MAQQDGNRVHVASRGQHLARDAAPPAVAGAFDTCPLVERGDVTLQAVACLVIPALASLQRAPLGVLAQSRSTARVNQRLLRQQAAAPGSVQLSSYAMGQPVGLDFTRTQIDRLAGVYVVGLGNAGAFTPGSLPGSSPESLPGSLSLNAGRDINAQAAVIANTSANGNTNIQAAKDIRLSTVTTDFAAATGGGANYMTMQTSQDVDSSINSNGTLTVSAGNNLTPQPPHCKAAKAQPN